MTLSSQEQVKEHSCIHACVHMGAELPCLYFCVFQPSSTEVSNHIFIIELELNFCSGNQNQQHGDIVLVITNNRPFPPKYPLYLSPIYHN